jgi:hypothetical protein
MEMEMEMEMDTEMDILFLVTVMEKTVMMMRGIGFQRHRLGGLQG